MAKKTPTLRGTKLYWYDGDAERENFICDMVKDRDRWLKFLENEKAFRYIAVDGTSCTAIKEKRRAFGSEKIIIVRLAHRRLGGKLQRRYLGQAENITQAKLKLAAFALSQRPL